MAVLVIFARHYGRLYDIKTALLFSAVVMVMWQPYILIFDAAFQLSFIATLGLIYGTPLLEKKLTFLTNKLNLRSIVSATIATQFFVLPLLIYHIGEVSLVALPVNILILPIVPITMLFGAITGVVGFISYDLSYVFGVITTLIVDYQLFIVSLFEKLPFSTIQLNF
jgi:competence protein ComEC